MKDKQAYSTPKLEQHEVWHISTGVSLPIGTSSLGDFLETESLLEEK